MEANMWQLISPDSRFDLIGKAKPCIALSLLVILIGIGSIVYHGGLNQGIDFHGIANPILSYWQQYTLRPQNSSRRVTISH
jgi:preprotein translocase subunit SecF